jgi:ferredoxin
MIKIIQDQDKCIGCGACVGVCPDNWQMTTVNGMTKSKPKKTQVKDIGCNQEAADVCPVKCIKIEKK